MAEVHLLFELCGELDSLLIFSDVVVAVVIVAVDSEPRLDVDDPDVLFDLIVSSRPKRGISNSSTSYCTELRTFV